MEPRVPNCVDPELGRHLEPYLEGGLDPGQREAFELHYFRCAACLELLQLHQDLAHSRPRSRVWVGVAALAAAAVLGFLFFAPVMRKGATSPILIVLDGTLRSAGAGIPEVPAGRTIDLRLRVPVPNAEGVRYAIRILDPAGGEAYSLHELPPSGPNEVRVSLPGLAHAGRHEVVLEERVPGEDVPLAYRFALEVTEAPR